MTVLMDTLFRTVKHPKADAPARARGEIAMSDAEKQRSAELTHAILHQRGFEALRRDDAAGREGKPAPAPPPPMTRAKAA